MSIRTHARQVYLGTAAERAVTTPDAEAVGVRWFETDTGDEYIWDGSAWVAGGGGGGAPVDAQYLTLALDGTLTQERRFVPGDGLAATDGGAGGDYDIEADIDGLAALGAAPAAADEFMLYDDTAGALRKVTWTNVLAGISEWKLSNVVVVSSSGDGDYATIAAAIAAVGAGDVILVDAGTYTCDNQTLPSGVDMIGLGRATILQTTTQNTALTLGGGNTIRAFTVIASLSSAATVTALNINGSSCDCYDIYAIATNLAGLAGDAIGIDLSDVALQLFWCQGIGNTVGGGTGYGAYATSGYGNILYGWYESSTGYGIYFNNPGGAYVLTLPRCNGSTSDVTSGGGTAPEGWFVNDDGTIRGVTDGVVTMDELAAKPAAPATNSFSLYFLSDGLHYEDDAGTDTGPLGAGGSETVERSVVDGRLTLSATLAVPTSDITAATTLYYLPYVGEHIALYDGVSAWAYHEIPAIASPCSVSLAGLAANLPHDVFIYDSAGTLTLDVVVWTNTSTRATALAIQDGVYVKTGATARRYIGTIMTTGTIGQVEDSDTIRFVWNYYNRVSRRALKHPTGSHSYSTATWRYWNGTGNNIQFVVGVIEDHFTFGIGGDVDPSADGVYGILAAGHNTTSGAGQPTWGHRNAYIIAAFAFSINQPTLGWNYVAALEYASAASVTFTYADVLAYLRM